MRMETAGDMADFLSRHGIGSVNLMGGEVWLNPDWREILSILCDGRAARIVSNGDFGDDFLDFLSGMDGIHLSISNDRWHRPRDIDGLRERIGRRGIPFNIDGDNGRGLSQAGVVPVGRGLFDGCESMYGQLAAYCLNPANAYSFLIDETGDIFKCPFGIWKLANIRDFPERDFFAFFREKWGLFRTNSPFTCMSCVKAHEWKLIRDKKKTRKFS